MHNGCGDGVGFPSDLQTVLPREDWQHNLLVREIEWDTVFYYNILLLSIPTWTALCRFLNVARCLLSSVVSSPTGLAI